MSDNISSNASFFDEDFKVRVKRLFTENADQVVEMVEQYAEFIDNHEKLLLLYIQLPLGPILLYEWIKRMNTEALRKEWFEKNLIDKDVTLSFLYSEIAKTIAESSKAKVN